MTADQTMDAMNLCQDLMYSDPVTMKMGYTAPNAVLATAAYMKRVMNVTMTPEDSAWLLSVASDPLTGWEAAR